MSPCQGCHSGCCRAFAVPVTGADLIQMEHQLRQPMESFIHRWEDPNGMIACETAPHFYFEDQPGLPYTICLKPEVSATFRNVTRCHFLVEQPPTPDRPLGTAQCGIYGQRPLVCRIFPTKLSETGMLAELHGIPEHGRPSDPHPAYGLCSTPWNVADVEPVAAVQDLVLIHFEMKFFRQVAASWNRRPQSWSVWPDFLRLVYQNRVIPETAAQECEEPLPAILKFSEATRSRAA
ncbi:YkgJ family cysteine cluster protein [bacterium]|nr:YkgJ family cysteine cluster protein [bacterium]